MVMPRKRVDLNDRETHEAWNTAAEELRIMVSDAMACGHSREACEKMQRDGSLNKAQGEIVSALLAEAAPRTAGELAAAMAHAGPNHANRNNVAARLSELSRRNVVQSGITRPCTVTGTTVYEWSLTGMPAGPRIKRAPSKAAQMESLLKRVSMGLASNGKTGLSPEACERWAERIRGELATIKEG